MINKKNRLSAECRQPFFSGKRIGLLLLGLLLIVLSGNPVLARTAVPVGQNKSVSADEVKQEPKKETKKQPAKQFPQLGESTIVGSGAVVLFNNRGANVYQGNGTKIIADVSGNGKSIISQSHYLDEALSEFTIPDGVQLIENFAFARSGLKQITIPEGVTSIGYAAFYHCDSLETVSIPSGVTEIGAEAFGKTLWMGNWESKEEEYPYLIVGDGILIAYKGNQNTVILPEEIKQIGPGAFKDHRELVEVSLPESLWAVRKSAFEGCEKLTVISGEAAPTLVEENAFEGCGTSISSNIE